MYKREAGFTLLETLVCLLILMLLIVLTPNLTYVAKPSTAEVRRFEWILYAQQLQIEFREAKQVIIANRKLSLLQRDGTWTSYIIQGTTLVRKVNQRGNEYMLQHVKNITYIRFTTFLTIQMVDTDDKPYETTVTQLIGENSDEK